MHAPCTDSPALPWPWTGGAPCAWPACLLAPLCCAPGCQAHCLPGAAVAVASGAEFQEELGAQTLTDLFEVGRPRLNPVRTSRHAAGSTEGKADRKRRRAHSAACRDAPRLAAWCRWRPARAHRAAATDGGGGGAGAGGAGGGALPAPALHHTLRVPDGAVQRGLLLLLPSCSAGQRDSCGPAPSRMRLWYCAAFGVQYLRALAAALAPCGPSALFYLAAAVSDFFMPWAEMVRCSWADAAVGFVTCLAAHVRRVRAWSRSVSPAREAGVREVARPAALHVTYPYSLLQAEHKIQSAGGPLTITLSKVGGQTKQAGERMPCPYLLQCWLQCAVF